MRHKIAAFVTLSILLTVSSAQASFERDFNKGLGSIDSHITNLKTFEGNTNRIFSRLSQGQRDEIAKRVDYVLQRAELSKTALKAYRDARRDYVDTNPGALTGKKRYNAMVKAIDAFEDYRALFDSSVGRCFIDTPEPRYIRIKRQLDKVPWYRYGVRGALRKELEQAFNEYSEKFISSTLKAFQPRRDAFFHSLKNLQYSSSGFDLGLQYRFDRAFYGYQALFSEKSEPGYGVPTCPEFPVDSPLAELLVYRPTIYGKQYSRAMEAKEVDKLLPDSYSDIKELPPEALSREARRIKELQDLVSTYERAAQRGDKTALDESWRAYHQLREKWDKVE